MYHKFFYRAGMCMDQSDDASLILPIDTELCVIGVPCGSFHPHVRSGRGQNRAGSEKMDESRTPLAVLDTF